MKLVWSQGDFNGPQGYVYVCGQATAGQGGDDAVVAKFNASSGYLEWQFGLGAGSTQNWRNMINRWS